MTPNVVRAVVVAIVGGAVVSGVLMLGYGLAMLWFNR